MSGAYRSQPGRGHRWFIVRSASTVELVYRHVVLGLRIPVSAVPPSLRPGLQRAGCSSRTRVRPSPGRKHHHNADNASGYRRARSCAYLRFRCEQFGHLRAEVFAIPVRRESGAIAVKPACDPVGSLRISFRRDSFVEGDGFHSATAHFVPCVGQSRSGRTI